MGLLLALLGAAALAQPGAYTIGSGDTLDVQVFQEADLTGKYFVGEGGTIEMPLVGSVQAAGLTVAELTVSLTEDLGARYLRNPQVSIRVDVYGSQPVRVLGEVGSPGVYYLTGPTSLQELLAKAGGVKTDRSTQEAIIKNEWDDASPQQVINLSRLRDTGEGNVLLRGGDVVYISEGQAVYVGGEVKKPGSVPFKEGLTVLQALTEAGGFAPTASARRAYILRDGGRIALNMRRIQKGRDADVTLQNGDQLFIEESVF